MSGQKVCIGLSDQTYRLEFHIPGPKHNFFSRYPLLPSLSFGQIIGVLVQKCDRDMKGLFNQRVAHGLRDRSERMNTIMGSDL